MASRSHREASPVRGRLHAGCSRRLHRPFSRHQKRNSLFFLCCRLVIGTCGEGTRFREHSGKPVVRHRLFGTLARCRWCRKRPFLTVRLSLPYRGIFSFESVRRFLRGRRLVALFFFCSETKRLCEIGKTYFPRTHDGVESPVVVAVQTVFLFHSIKCMY